MRFARYLSLSFLFVLLFCGVFSSSCYATETYSDDLTFQAQMTATTSGSTGWQVNNTNKITNISIAKSYFYSRTIDYYLSVKKSDGSILLHKGREATIQLTGGMLYAEGSSTDEIYYPYNTSSDLLEDGRIRLYTIDGYDSTGKLISMTGDFDVKAYSDGRMTINIKSDPVLNDIVSLRIRLTWENPVALFGSFIDKENGLAIKFGFNSSNVIIIEESSEEDGILKKILAFVEQIRGGVDNLITGIIELPSKIMEGIKNLFVPDPDFITGYKDRFDSLLSEHFGAVYDSISLVDELADAFMSNVSDKTTIHMPTVTIPLGDTEFSFGGYDVKLVPDKFIPIVDILKMLIGLVCTLLFVMMLKHRYEEVISK